MRVGSFAVILSLLREHGPLRGAQIVERSDGYVRAGTVYALLHELEDRGLVVSWTDSHDPLHRAHPEVPARRKYALRKDGSRVQIDEETPEGEAAPA